MSQSPSNPHCRSFELTDDHATYVDHLVATGTFATGSDVVNAGLEALRERDSVIERWLVDEVVPTYDRMMENPSRGLSADEVRGRLAARREERLRAGGLVTRTLVYSPEASGDLEALSGYIAERSGEQLAQGYVDRIMAACDKLQTFPERGHKRDDLRPGLRIIGFERRVAIAFHLTATQVIVDRVLYGGRDLGAAFDTPRLPDIRLS